ncbi:MAG TPA: autotransporter-associated beta strand repeat-containing protein, partial [Chthoniobacteraceae bacterium]|nr:autotransporter-associated beta strand repeat-containing protein [Chthoniobacteraceae bacterium]
MNLASSPNKRIFLTLAVVALGTFVFTNRGSAANFTWSSTTTGTNFGTTTNWASDTAPQNGGAYSLEFGAAGSYTTLNNNLASNYFELLFDSTAPAYTIVGNAFTLSTSSTVPAVVNNSPNVETIDNTITWGASTGTIVTNGTGGDIYFGGYVSSSVSGGPTFDFDAPLTTFGDGFGMSQSTGARTNIFGGVGGVTINGLSNGASTSADTFQWENSGTLTLQGTTSIFGTIDFYAGTTVLTGTLASGGASDTITVGDTAIASSSTGVNTGNATLLISGNYGYGTAGASAQSLIILGGTGTNSGQGTLSMVDGSINTLTINTATASATTLTMGGAATKSSILDMEIGNNSSDEIILANNGKASIGAGGVTVNITGIGGFTSASGSTFTLISAPGGGLATFTLGSTNTGNYGGFYGPSLSISGTGLLLNFSGYYSTPTSAYWDDNQSTVWNTLTGGTNNNSNWATSSAGTTDTHQAPGAATNVYFGATTGTNFSTTLGADTTINSLTFTTGSNVSISGNVLTLNASGANGITVSPGSGSVTIASNVTLGSSQTWSINNAPANPLTVNGVIGGGANGLTMSGTGELVLGGSNTFTGGLTINNGTVVVSSSGAMNATSPNAVTFGAGTSTGTLEIDGFDTTLSSLSTDATPGTAVVENGGVSPNTLTIAQVGNTTYAGVLQDGGSGSLNLTKTGAGVLTLGGVNTYSGATTVSNGTLAVNGSLGSNSTVTVSATVDGSPAIIGGTGAINGPVILNTPADSLRYNEITGGIAGSTGTLTLTDGLTLNTGAIAYLPDGAYINITGGGLTVTGTGVIIKVSSGLGAGTYPLIGYNLGTDPTLADFILENLNGSTAGGNYMLVINSNGVGSDVLDLTVQNASTAIPSITLTAPTSGARVMASTTIAVGGEIDNSGVVSLNATLADNGGNLTVTGFSPSNPIVVGTGGSVDYTASANTGSNLGNNTLSVEVTDTNASPTTVSATTTVDVVSNRVVTPSTVPSFGLLH